MRFLLGLFTLVLYTVALAQQPDKQAPPKKDAAALVVLDKAGKEFTLKNWQFTVGVKAFAPSAEPVKKGDKAPTGPLYLEFRQDNSTTYKEGILTLIPLASLSKIDYDNEKKTVAVTVAQADGKETVHSGTTKYVGINKLNVKADADLGPLGFATITYQGGQTANPLSVRGFRFPEPKAVPEPTGPVSVITSVEKDKTEHKAHDLKVLYRVGSGYRLSSALMFKKTVKIDLAQLTKLRHVESEDKKQVSHDYEVTFADGKQLTLTLLQDMNPEDAAPAQLVGLLGKVAVGYRLFPLHTVGEMRLDKTP